MRVLWSLEKIPNRNWEIQADLLGDSVRSWKLFYPEDTLVLYCDEYTQEHLNSLGLLKDFSEVNKVSYLKYPLVDSKVFWASIKMRSFLEERESFIFMDNDFQIYGPILDKVDLSKICFTFSESTGTLYPTLVDPILRTLQFPFRMYQIASNTSFLVVPDIKFIQEFATTSLTLMEDLSRKGVANTLYMIFLEQLLFRNYIKHRGKDYQSLYKSRWHASKCYWEGHGEPNGIFEDDEVIEYFRHVGPAKDISL